MTDKRVVAYQDMWVTCPDCRDNFLWSVKEQELYSAKGYPPPTRCRGCKQAQRFRPQKKGGRK